MVKKITRTAGKKKTSAPADKGMLDSQIAGAVKESAQQIWLAGMGAFSKAQEEGGKVFDALVKEGMALQRKTQAAAEEKIGEVTGRMTRMAEGVTHKAGQNWDKLEAIFEQRTEKALARLGVPTAKDVDALVKRVDELAAAVARLSKGGGAAAKVARKTRGKAAVVAEAPAKTVRRRTRKAEAAPEA
ncbi:MAG: phasin family protein [Rubrivivax sp.]|jgi:poly(hydroxyalkanoate) granule-associated protein|nr:phasin family protein [Rubrivivax sp.]